MQIYSVFSSVNGEVTARGIGSPTTFVRFAGCSANCPYCDTTYASDSDSGWDLSLDAVMDLIHNYPCRNVTITGGEPFEQRSQLQMLLRRLAKDGYRTTVETNGFHNFTAHDYPETNWVVDIKTHVPIELNRFIEMELTEDDFIKVVINSHEQYYEMKGVKERLQEMGCKAQFAFSPEYGEITASMLYKWIMKTGNGDIYLNFQAHKVLNLPEVD